ncbi:hypothetical protein [Streptomyces sp. NPDC001530]|uniref:hypothetical protein n=1 Tax=Streptomyces sp. NPDC001530 TaxID=3364582 RepID=UPI0036BC03A8
MSAKPIMEPVMRQQDPIDLLIAIEEASQAPIRPEYIEGMAIVPPQPNDKHNHCYQFAGTTTTGAKAAAGDFVDVQ